jgi:prolyl-tRNA synthetase
MIVPIAQHKEGVLEATERLKNQLKEFRVQVDDSDKSPGWKFSEQEIRGIPLRIEIGPKDIEAGQGIIKRRDTREKISAPLNEMTDAVKKVMETMQAEMLERARSHRDEHTCVVADYEEFKAAVAEKPGFIKAMCVVKKPVNLR